ncbi:alkaline phosphatase family protein [Cyclobacterium plantarum]|uniref:Alkaline phosphatase family protein n=1 Tax=Cyclobacterium plantarum TaxID=2716263 RepID=A0ABX0HCM1_9BACT|nr:alkaline phosphatase family protein [Cyclobacterium plantarum]NHE59639.1 alkaline phosphatase family protein [Cyclobacterium plantarum]
MKLSIYTLTFLFAGIFLMPFQTEAQEKKTLFIILDGIQRELLIKNPTPNMDEIISEGGYFPAHVGGAKGGYSETPTISAVGYNSLLTGVWVNKHNVKGNSIRRPNYNYWTIFRHFKENYPNKTTAVYSTWLDNRTKLVGENLEATGHLQLDYHFDGLEVDTLGYPHDDKSEYIKKIDQEVAAYAAKDISRKAPDLTWVYLQYTDDMGHRFGASPEMDLAIQEADRQVGLIWSAIKEREKEFDEDWMIAITTDHGRGEGGFHHGGQSDEERATWIISNQSFNEIASNIPGIVDLFPTIANYMHIEIPKNQAMEVDGVSLWGEAYASHLKGTLNGNLLNLNWKDYGSGEKAKIWVTPTNQFRYGNSDLYRLLGETDLAKETVELDLKMKYDNLKVVLELPEGFINVWLKNQE